MTDARLLALRCLVRIERDKGYSNIVLEQAFRQEPPQREARAFCAALVYGVVERRITLDAILAPRLKHGIDRLDPEVRSVLRMGAYQLYYMRSVPASAAVNESIKLCRAARKSSASGLVNAVLRALVREGCPPPTCNGDELDRLCLAVSAPRELAEHLMRCYGFEAAKQALESALHPAPLFIRRNPLAGEAEGFCRLIEGEGAQIRPYPGVPEAYILEGVAGLEKLKAFTGGGFHVQDLSSQRCALSLEAGPGMRVLDVCAAPGGKAFTLAEEMENQGEVVACDLYPHKLELIQQGAVRLGLTCIIPKVQDATVYNNEFADFDRILCDVPCSGLGILRRKPEIKYKSLQVLESLPAIQYKILENSSHYLRNGGRLVYSTCTLNPAENEDNVERFLQEHSDFERQESPVLEGNWRKTFLPGEEEGGDGFFIAVLKRTERA